MESEGVKLCLNVALGINATKKKAKFVYCYPQRNVDLEIYQKMRNVKIKQKYPKKVCKDNCRNFRSAIEKWS